MEDTCELLGWPPDGPKLRLDYRQFSYAGKFVMTGTGKAVVRGERTGVHNGERERDVHKGERGGERSSGPKSDENADNEPEYDRSIIAALAFNEDRTDSDTLWLRYLTVRTDRQGEGLGPELVAFVRERAIERGYERLKIGVNNPFSYQALVRAGFGYTGEKTGLAELVLEYPGSAVDTDSATENRYHEGIRQFLERSLTAEERTFIKTKLTESPPEQTV